MTAEECQLALTFGDYPPLLTTLIGTSQGQLANTLRGHDPISAAAVNRLRKILLGGSQI